MLRSRRTPVVFFFFFNDTATTEIYTLSLHDALPIYRHHEEAAHRPTPERDLQRPVETGARRARRADVRPHGDEHADERSEEHTSELQSQSNLVCRLLLEKKKKILQRRKYKRHNPRYA